MRQTASPSRPHGRYAIGLRPSLDPYAYIDATSQDKKARTTNQTTTQFGLDRPHSFRNDLRFSCFTGDVVVLPDEWSWHPRMSDRLGMYRYVAMSGDHEVMFTNPI
jgi:hypothetical protein